jgi:predicted DNA-binding WGR domain protein
MSAVHLIRIDPARNMRRFYRFDVQPDLFSGFAVVKEWGRIGHRGGRVAGEWHLTEALAAAAVQRQGRAQAAARLLARLPQHSPGFPHLNAD